ncbi:C4-type Zn-finger protein [Paenibacillus shirakamiensis]|uniref:C4-type Zn-finger protein n=1 Tax=Paenibacillus shirakamiensis TaxID=1265935 RepID=A0ABS4JEE0_9BACL|nr:Ig-like domain-containing protein [Paenibacillus shirakamiensis]MBP2000088.1 C4-type Zn-finger protein [Paenibacillus shirakamiensis]
MAFILRYNTTMNGAMTFTGNTLGLNKVANQNNQGTAGSIGAFITLNTSSQVGNFPLGTTLDYTQNSSAAILSLPTGSTVLYAELVWAGSYNYGGSDVSAAIANPIKFTTPAGTFSITPDPATAANTAPAANFYVNSANVTSLVQQGGIGTYVAGAIPGTAAATENNSNFTGWTLAVAYASPFLPSRNMSIFVGAEIVNATIGAATASITGFATPVTGVVTGRLMVSACEGDPQIAGDQALFGPTAAQLVAISGPNNLVNNFFASQINNDQGLLNTNGTFGNLNSTPGTAVIGARQGWDITNVDVSPELVNSQTTAVIQLLSTQDQYLVNSVGLQVDVNAPFFVFNKSSNVTSAFVGDIVQYTITASNQGTASATLVLLTDNFPASGNFVPGSLSVDGVPQPAASPVTGLNLGVITPGQTITVVYSVQIVSRPTGSTQSNVANLTYNFQSLPNGPTFQGMSQSNGNNVTINNRPPTVPNYNYTTNKNVPVSAQVVGTDPDGDPLTYTLNSTPNNGTVVVNPNGTFTYTPNPGYVGQDSFTVLVSDGQGGTAVSTVTVTIVDQPPTAQNLNLSTNKNTPVNGQVIATDPDGDPLTYALNSPPANGTVTVNPNGSLIYTPNPGFSGTDSFTVIVSDPNGKTAISTVTVQVTNRPPTTQNVNLTTPENIPVSGQVVGIDPDGDPLTYTLNSQPTNGTVTLNPNGTFTYTPNPNFIGVDTFTVLVADPSGGTAVSKVTINVVNLPPVTQNVSLSTSSNIPVSGQVIATDPNGDPLTFTLNSPPANGTAVVNPDGTFTYTPNTGFAGTDNFTVLVSDGRGGTALSNVSIQVTNLPPVAQNQTITTPGNTPISGQVIATDPNADPLTYALNSVPSNGTAVVNPDGSFTYTPTTGFSGTDTFTVIVKDPAGASAIATVTVIVQNLPPVTSDQSLSTLQNTPVSGQIIATDPNAHPLTYSLLSPPTNGTVTVNPDGSFTYVPATGFVGKDTFSVLVSDGQGGTAVSTVTIDVANQPPVVTNQVLYTPQNTAINGQVVATDPDGNPLTYALQSPPGNGTAIVNPNGSFTYTPANGFVGLDSFTVLVSDGKGGTAVGSISINVIDQPPVAQDLSLSTNFNTPLNGQIPATDPDGDPLTYTVTTPPANGTLVLDPATGAFTYTPNNGFLGVDTFTVLVSDGKGGTAVSNVQIGVPVSPPVTSNLVINTNANVPVPGQILASDPQGETLTYTLTTPPSNGTVTLDPATGAFTYTPNPGFVGTDTFVVTVTNSSGVPVTSTVSVNVDNQPPVAQNLTVGTVQNTPVNGQIIAIDPDGNPLTYTLATPPTLGTVIVNNDGSFTYTPNPGVVGTDTFSVLVSDGLGGTATSIVTVNIIDQPPVTQDVKISTPANIAVNGAVIATDPDGNPLTFTLNSSPANGTVTVNPDGTFTYTPNPGYIGPDSFTVLVSDGKGGTALSTVSVNVFNLPPVATGTTVNTLESVPVNGAVTAVDPEGGPVTFTLLSPPVNGTVVVNPDGTFTYTPNPGFVGQDSFSVLATDSLGATDAAGVIVNVAVNPPTTTDVNLVTNINIPVAGQVTATDPAGDPLTFSLISAPVNGVAVVNPNGTFTYTPNPGFSGQDSFTVLVDDGKGGTAVSTVQIQVVNQPPVVQNEILNTPQSIPVNGTVIATDPDGDPLTYIVGNPPVNGTVVLNPNGTFTYTPNPGFVGTDFFTVNVADTHGGTASGVITINVRADIPVVSDQTVSTNSNTPVTGKITATDPDGEPLTIAVLSPPANGTVTVNPDGTYTYTPNPGFVGTDSFTVQATNIGGGVGTGVVTVQVNNIPPVAVGTSISTLENTPVNGAVTATSPLGNPLTFALNSPPVNGTAIVNPDGTFTYTPNPGYVGQDTFTVIVTDPFGGTSIATVTVTVSGQPPITQNQNLLGTINTPLSGTIIASSPSGDPLTYTLGSLPTNGTVVQNPDGTFVYTPNPNFAGVDSFTTKVTSSNGTSVISTVTITIPILPPVINNTQYTVFADLPLNGQLDASSPEGIPVTVQLASPPTNGTVVVNPDGSFTYQPNQAFVGTDTFTVTATDSNGASTTGTVTILVIAGPLVAPDVFLTTPVNIPVSGRVQANDPDSSSLIYTLYNPLAANGTAVVNPDGTFTYTPNPGFTGVDKFPVIVTDAYGLNTIAVVTITVVGDVPVGPPVNVVTTLGQSVSGVVQVTDPSGLPVTYSLGNPPSHGDATVNADGSFTYTPDPNYVGPDSFTVIATNSAGALTIIPVNVTVVSSGGTGPVTTDIGIGTNAGQPVSGQILANSPEGLPLTYTVGTAPSHGTIVLNPNGGFTYTPDANFTGNDSFTVVITDSAGRSVTSTVSVVVYPVNVPPVPVNPGAPTNPNTPTTINATLSTIEGVPVRGAVPGGPGAVYNLVTNPSQGVVALGADGSYVYTPNPGFVGTDRFVIRYTDAQGKVYLYIVTVTVAAASTPTSGSGNTGTTPNTGGNAESGNTLTLILKGEENRPFNGNVNSLGLGSIVRARVVKGPLNAKLSLNEDGSFRIVPNRNSRKIQFTIIVTNELGKEYTINITVILSQDAEE